MPKKNTGASFAEYMMQREKRKSDLLAELSRAQTPAVKEEVSRKIEGLSPTPIPQKRNIPLHINPDEYDPRTGGLDTAKNDIPVKEPNAKSPVSTWRNPDEVDPDTGGLQESGTRNLVDPSAEIVDHINEAIKNGDRKALTTSLWQFANLGPSYAVAMDYNDRFQLQLVNGETHVIDKDNKTDEEFNNAADALKYIDNALWIPDVMQLNGMSEAEGYLAYSLDNLPAKQVEWDQTKINTLWQAVVDINNQYTINVDPRFLLAVIIHEGTGSFNTSSTNRAADGQHGVETNYATDLMKANKLVFGKILGYIYYGDDFRKAVASNNNKSGISGNGDIFQYCNWKTPIIDIKNNTVWSGVYATHGAWETDVRNIYNTLTGGSAQNYEAYISGIDKGVVVDIADDLGIKLPSYNFVANKDSQYSWGGKNDNWTIGARN